MADDTSRCHECGAELPRGGPFCLHCGAATGASLAPRTVSEVTPPPGPRPFTPFPGAAGTPTPALDIQPVAPAEVALRSDPVVPLPSTAQTQPVADDERPTPGGGTPRGLATPPSEEAPAFRPGDRVLSTYRIVRELGHGGMGAVYLGHDDLTGQRVAIKVLPASLAREKGIRERFTLEAKALAALDHPNIVPLISYAQEGDDRFLIMKYVEGTALDALIEREGKLDFERAQRIFSAIVSALGYAHDHGVIHRDVKPANVLIADDGRIYLVDFGIAKKEESVKLTQTGMLMGTPQYMSPELISGHPIDGRSDLYAAGLILFEMLTGRPPFVGERTFTVLRAHVEASVPDPEALRGEAIPRPLLGVLDRLLKKNPAARPADAAATLELLSRHDLDTPVFGAVTHPEPAGLTPSLADSTTTAVTQHLAPADLHDDLANAFGRQQSRAAFGFLLGAVALLVAAGLVVFAFPDVLRGGPQGPPRTEEEAAADLLVKKAEKALKKSDTTQALNLLLSIEGRMRDRADVVSLEADVHLARRDLAKARTLIKSLEGHKAALSEDLRAHLPEQKAELERLEGARASRRRSEQVERSKLPKELSDEQILDVTEGRASRQQLKDCWERTVLRETPDAAGLIKVKVTVDPDGTVRSASVIEQTVGTDRFRQCVLKTVDRWRFPEFQGPGALTVTQALKFVSGEG